MRMSTSCRKSCKKLLLSCSSDGKESMGKLVVALVNMQASIQEKSVL
jgi:hypothetical protein